MFVHEEIYLRLGAGPRVYTFGIPSGPADPTSGKSAT